MQLVQLLVFLILFPLLAAVFLLAARKDRERAWIVKIASLGIGAVLVYLLVMGYDKGTQLFNAGSSEYIGQAMFLIEIVVAVFLLYMGIRHRNYLVIGLVTIQTLMMAYFEAFCAHGVEVKYNLFFDQFSIIMALIVGIIGSFICVYALGYMKHFHEHHKEIADRRPWFFFVLFAFLSAMFGLVFSNNIIWVYFFWEITTLCSFLLIGYTRTEEATRNAFNALWMNLLGGVAFTAALIYLATAGNGVMEIDQLLMSGKAIALIPAALIGFAGLTKSAQLPFSGWLVGAMVAPTPVSALLHSSAMVKAGVYILVRLAPIFTAEYFGYALAFVGAVTFLIASGIAISRTNAKQVLAYSTIANLGLVVACAGIGTYEAVWAAILLIIFHAITKSLLFMSVGTIEHRISSRDIESMDGLIIAMPKLTAMMLIGIAGMFLAPFGMLISKWVAIRAFIDAGLVGIIFVIILAFGSAITVFFWAKWMGKIITVAPDKKYVEGEVDHNEWIALVSMAAITVITCFIFPIISTMMLEPFLSSHYGQVARLAQDNIIIMMMMLALLVVLPLSVLLPHRKRRHLPPYMAGMTTDDKMHYTGSIGTRQHVTLSNYYLDAYFGEAKLLSLGIWGCSALIGVMLVSAIYLGVFL